MRIGGKILVCTAALAAMFIGSALAADTSGGFSAESGTTVTYDTSSKQYSISYSGSDLVNGNQYALLVVKSTDLSEKTYSVGESTIMYIDQAAASGGSVSFDKVIPKSTPDCVVLLGGSFDGTTTGPKILGTIEGQGVTVSGTVTSYNPKNAVTLELYTTGTTANPVATGSIAAQSTGSGQVSQSFSIESVPAGTYDLKVSKTGHAVYWLTGIQVGDSDLIITNAISMPCGDVNKDSFVNGIDINNILSTGTYNQSSDKAANPDADLNGDNAVNGLDINIILSKDNYNQKTVTKEYAN